jgi:ketosteroid isomerase-like protein
MSREDVETVRGVYRRWGEGDFVAAVELFDPKVLLVMRPDFPDTGTYLGLDGVAEYTRGFLEPWSHITIAAEEIIEAGDTVVVRVLQRGEGVESGALTEFRYFHVWSFRGGKVIRFETVRERADALEAAGIRE